MTKATLTSYNQTPRKVRLVTNMVKGKPVEKALVALEFLPRRAAEPVAKLIKSAVANAKQKGEEGTLVVKSITVDSAGMLKKYVPRAFGRSAPVRHRKSQVTVVLEAKKVNDA